MTEYTQVRLRRTTIKRLKSIGKMGESYDNVINNLITEYMESIDDQEFEL